MITTTIIAHLVTETNRFARQSIGNNAAKLKKWKDVTATCIKAFLGIIILMGIVRKNNLKDYWSTDASIDTPYIRSVMSRDRFLQIMQYLHLNNNENAPRADDPQRDRLFKIRPVYDILRHQFFTMASPDENIAIDEASIPWKGNLSFKVYNPQKPNKHHIKIYELCDSKTGYCHIMEFYTGKTGTPSDKGATYDLVMRIMNPYLDLGYKLWLDNYYVGPVLFQDLFDRD